MQTKLFIKKIAIIYLHNNINFFNLIYQQTHLHRYHLNQNEFYKLNFHTDLYL